MKSEVKVGLLFFIGLGLLLAFTLFVNDMGGGDGAYAVNFPRVNGLGIGDKVQYNGFTVGRVGNMVPIVDEQNSPAIRVSFDVDDDKKDFIIINDQSSFTIGQGLLGGSMLQIVTSGPGTGINQKDIDKRDGVPPSTISDAVNMVSEVIQENRSDIRSAVAALPSAVENFSELSGEMGEVVDENRVGIKRAIDNLGDMGGSISTMVEENKKILNEAIANVADVGEKLNGILDENRDQFKKAVDRLPDAINNFADAAGEVKDMIKENREDVKKAVGSIAAFGPNLEKIGEDVAVITDQIVSGQGTIGKLVFEDSLHTKAERALGSFEQRLEELEPVTSGFSDLKLFVGTYGGMNTTTGQLTGHAYVRIEPRPWKFYEGGVSYRTKDDKDRSVVSDDPSDMNMDINLLFGWRFLPDDNKEQYRLSAAVGLIESRFGARMSMPIYDRFTAQLMIRAKANDWQTNERRYEDGDVLGRLTMNYRVWNRCYLTVGADDLFEDAAPFIGLRAELLDNDIRNFTAASSLAP